MGVCVWKLGDSVSKGYPGKLLKMVKKHYSACKNESMFLPFNCKNQLWYKPEWLLQFAEIPPPPVAAGFAETGVLGGCVFFSHLEALFLL